MKNDRLVNSHLRNSYCPETDCRTETIRAALQTALQALEGVPDGHAVGIEHAAAVARAFDAIHHAERILPYVEGWVCGYFWNEGTTWSGFTAHTAPKEAEAFRAAWERKERKRGQDSGWVVRQMPADIYSFVQPGTNPVAYVNASGAFN